MSGDGDGDGGGGGAGWKTTGRGWIIPKETRDTDVRAGGVIYRSARARAFTVNTASDWTVN